MHMYVHVYLYLCIHSYTCTATKRHLNPREIREPSQQANAWLVWLSCCYTFYLKDYWGQQKEGFPWIGFGWSTRWNQRRQSWNLDLLGLCPVYKTSSKIWGQITKVVRCCHPSWVPLTYLISVILVLHSSTSAARSHEVVSMLWIILLWKRSDYRLTMLANSHGLV